ncbi:MAG: DUF3127 domain-containing protein [Bacteroidota bacterium]
MDLQISGRVVKVLEEQSGESKNGPWRKRDFILETGGQYPRQVCVTQWGDNIDQADVSEGEQVTAHINLSSREYNGRWYTDVKAWKIEKGDSNGGNAPEGSSDQSSTHVSSSVDLNNLSDSDIDDELPF